MAHTSKENRHLRFSQSLSPVRHQCPLLSLIASVSIARCSRILLLLFLLSRCAQPLSEGYCSGPACIVSHLDALDVRSTELLSQCGTCVPCCFRVRKHRSRQSGSPPFFAPASCSSSWGRELPRFEVCAPLAFRYPIPLIHTHTHTRHYRREHAGQIGIANIAQAGNHGGGRAFRGQVRLDGRCRGEGVREGERTQKKPPRDPGHRRAAGRGSVQPEDAGC